MSFGFAVFLFMGIIAVKYSTSVKLLTDTKDNWIVQEKGYHSVMFIIRVFHGCGVRIGESVRGSLFGITRLCRVMPNSDPEGRSFLSMPSNHDRFFFLHTF